MALFDQHTTIVPARRAPLARSTKVGVSALAIALVLLAAMSFLPTGYVIQQPGPVYDTLSTATTSDGETVPLIEIDGAETFDTAGALKLTTVQVVGNRERTPSWFELLSAWFTPSQAVVPIDAVFPQGQTRQQREEESAQMMVDSQHEATAAALTQLGEDVPTRVLVYAIPSGAPAEGVLEADDVIIAIDDAPVSTVDQLRAGIQAAAGAPVTLEIERDSTRRTVEVTPVYSEESEAWQVGVSTMHEYEFPIDVTIQLDNVGGPSAGMMFALGIIDSLTPGDLAGGADVAGTGTITADGTVGPIGGIRQKLYGARDSGADWFLAPQANCDEVTGHIPDGLQVFAVQTLDDAIAALEAIGGDGDTAALPTCTTG